MDNFYNSTSLAKTLKIIYKTNCAGALKLKGKDVTIRVENPKLKKARTLAQHSGPVSVTKGSDKKIITMISTYHSQDTWTVIIKVNFTVRLQPVNNRG
jgi:hypothetical protein